VLVEIANVRVAAEKPKQFVNDRFDVEFFRRQERKACAVGTQIKPRLRAEDRQCAGAGAIGARLTFLEHELEKVVILLHAKDYRGDDIRAKKKVVVAAVFSRTLKICA
jgi:hypothetical protein